MISFFSEDVSMPDIDIDKISYWVNSVIGTNKKISGDINYIFCSDEYLLEINKKYLNHDFYTDIITFNYNEDAVISSDIFISVERVNENAEFYKTTFLLELHRVIIHGILHLLGYNDETDEQEEEMRRLEDVCLKEFENVTIL